MKKKKLTEEIEDFVSYKFKQDEDVEIFKIILNRLKRRYNISSTELLNLTQEEIQIPSSIFTKKLSPLEANIKYLKENLELDYKKIAELLGRNRKTVWQAYKNASKKQSKKFEVEKTEYNIPVSRFKDELSILETAVVYLKEQYNLSYHYIAQLLQRDERTIWTVHHRAMKKIRK